MFYQFFQRLARTGAAGAVEGDHFALRLQKLVNFLQSRRYVDVAALIFLLDYPDHGHIGQKFLYPLDHMRIARSDADRSAQDGGARKMLFHVETVKRFALYRLTGHYHSSVKLCHFYTPRARIWGRLCSRSFRAWYCPHKAGLCRRFSPASCSYTQSRCPRPPLSRA